MADTNQGDGCACCGPAEIAVAAQKPGGSDVVCTLDGGPDAIRVRINEWQAVIGAATRREPTGGGVTLVYEHDPAMTVELARLAAAEFACCSFFTFALTVGPDGMRFTVTAPDEAADVLTAVFGGGSRADPAA